MKDGSCNGPALRHNGGMDTDPDFPETIVPDDGAGRTESPGTLLIYGAMGLGGSWDSSPVTDAEVSQGLEALDTAVEAGFRDIDLADIYTAGKSETVVGRWLKENAGLRDRVRLQTKAGIRLPGNTAPAGSPVHYRLDETALRGGLEGSLERLGVDSVDRFLVHRWDPLADPAEVAAVLDGLIDDGLTQGVGISNVSWHRIRVLQRHLQHPVQAIQSQLSLGHRDFVERQILWDHPEATEVDFSEELLDECAASGVELQAWGSLDRGRYTRPLEEGPDAATATLVHRLADELGCSPEAVVLAWLMRLPQGIRPVIGTTNPARIRACAQADAVVSRMTHEHWYSLLNSARGHDVP